MFFWEKINFNIILLVILVLFGAAPAISRELPHQFDYKAEDYPEYEKYFGEYQKQLDKVFEPEKYFSKHTDLYVVYAFRINSKGEISNMRPTFRITYEGSHLLDSLHPIYTRIMEKELPRYMEYIKELILANPPKPIPGELSYDSFWIYVSAHYYPKLNKHFARSLEKEPKVKYTALSIIGGDGKRVPPTWTIILYRGK